MGENFIFLTPAFPLRAGAAGGRALGLSASPALCFSMKSPHGTITLQPCQVGDEDLREKWGKNSFFLVQHLHFYFLFSQSISVSALCPLERMQKRGLNNEIKASRFIPWCPWVHCDEIGCGDIWVGGVAAATGSFLQQFVEVTSLPAVKFAPFYLWMMLRKRKRFVSSFYQLYYI